MNNDITQRAIELNHSRPFDVHRISDYPVVKNAVNHVVEQVIATSNYRAANRPTVLKKLHQATRALTLDLYLAYKSSPELWIGINLNKQKFSTRSRYKAVHLSYRPFKRTFDAFVELGFVDEVPGHYYRDGSGRTGHVTRIRATEQFIQVLESTQSRPNNTTCMQPLMIKNHPDQEVIICRNEDGNNIEYEDTDSTRLMRANLVAINNLLDSTYINLNISDSHYLDIDTRMRQHFSHAAERRYSNHQYVDLYRKRLRRVFNNSSFEQGGRFYGGYWQEIPKEYRPYIRIDGGSTVEVDYSGMHIAMLYAFQNSSLQGDPYTLEGFNGENDRKKLKKILNIMINAPTEKKAKGAMREIIRQQQLPEGYCSLSDVIEAYKRRHPIIERYFCSGYGVHLQYVDSRVAEAVMTRMMVQGAAVLPVHDSFIVRHEHRDDLIQLMGTEYLEYVGRSPTTVQNQTVFDLIEYTDPTEEHETLLTTSLTAIEQLYMNGNSDYSRYFEFDASWFQLNHNR
jgi:hypothetical protein